MRFKKNFTCKEELLVGDYFDSLNPKNNRTLFIHGAGKSNRNKVNYLRTELIKNRIDSFSFDFSGHGESTGKLENSSLNKRIFEAMEAISNMGTPNPLTIFASSMGGHIAIKLTQFYSILNLFLFCPAVYSIKAIDVEFNHEFSEIIRKPNSWEDSDIFNILREFRGNLFLYIGENDRIIPEGVIQKIDSSSVNTLHKEINIIEKADHQIHYWIENDPFLLHSISYLSEKYI